MALILRIYNENLAKEIAGTSRHMVHCRVKIEKAGESLPCPFRWGWLVNDDVEPPIFVASNGVLFKGDSYSFYELERIS